MRNGPSAPTPLIHDRPAASLPRPHGDVAQFGCLRSTQPRVPSNVCSDRMDDVDHLPGVRGAVIPSYWKSATSRQTSSSYASSSSISWRIASQATSASVLLRVSSATSMRWAKPMSRWTWRRSIPNRRRRQLRDLRLRGSLSSLPSPAILRNVELAHPRLCHRGQRSCSVDLNSHSDAGAYARYPIRYQFEPPYASHRRSDMMNAWNRHR
jgi:hypothetical protein